MQTFKNNFLSTTRMPSIQDVGICGHMLAFYIQPAPPFLRAMVLCPEAAGLKEWPPQLTQPGEKTQLPNPRQSVTAEVHGSIAFSESIECASPILISTFNL